jgi:hypothetical protein
MWVADAGLMQKESILVPVSLMNQFARGGPLTAIQGKSAMEGAKAFVALLVTDYIFSA